MNKTLNRISLAVVALLLAPVANAHPFHGTAIGFSAGFFHPFLGLDHLLAMTAIGIWMGRQSTTPWKAWGGVSLLLVAGMMLGIAGLTLPALDPLLAASVFMLGLLVTSTTTKNIAPTLLVGTFMLMHGMAHGMELPETLSVAEYGVGILVATLTIQAVGLMAGKMLRQTEAGFSRGVGLIISLIGALLFGNLLLVG